MPLLPDTASLLPGTASPSDSSPNPNPYLNPSGRQRLCSCSMDATIKIWDLASGDCELTLAGHGGFCRSVLQLANGDLLSGSDDRTIKVWNTLTGECKMTLIGMSFHTYVDKL